MKECVRLETTAATKTRTTSAASAFRVNQNETFSRTCLGKSDKSILELGK